MCIVGDTLVKPIIVNVGRAGAANLDVIQEVEYVKEDVKIPYLLQCLQKTAPPVIIFCERKGDVGKIINKVCLYFCFDQKAKMYYLHDSPVRIYRVTCFHSFLLLHYFLRYCFCCFRCYYYCYCSVTRNMNRRYP